MNNIFVLPGINYGRPLDQAIPGAPNFKYGEVVSSSTAVRLGIANVPTEAQWIAAEYYARTVLQPLRNKCGPITMSSWFRCKLLNSNPAVGSSNRSFHLTGGGGDLEPHDCSLMGLLEEAYKLPAFSEIIAEYFPHGWVHIGHLARDNRRILKLKDPEHDFEKVSIETLRSIYK